MSLDRRTFLKTAGLAAAGALAPWRSVATSPSPTRLLVFYTMHGCVYDTWRMRPGGRLGEEAWDAPLHDLSEAAFSPSLRPLWPWRDRISVIDGLALASPLRDRAGFAHTLGILHGWTGAPIGVSAGYPVPGAPSFDQLLVPQLAAPWQVPSLELGVGAFLAPGVADSHHTPLPAQIDPRQVWQRLFGGLPGGDSALLYSSRARLVDAVARRYEALPPGITAAGRARLDRHATLLRELEPRVGGFANVCPTAAPTVGPDGSYDERFEAQLALLQTAFSCDLTRVASLQLTQLPGEEVGQPGADVHVDFAHDIHSSTLAAEVLTAHTTATAARFARVLAALDAVEEGDGTVLDHTLVVWMSELADGAHGWDQWPVVLAGGAAGRFRLGRYLRFPATTPIAFEVAPGQVREVIGVPHQRFLLTAMRGLGMEVDRLGYGGLVGDDGSTVDCTSSLEGVLG